MIQPLQVIRLSKTEVDILNSIKRRTKITQWNVLCRMAFCISCADISEPPGLSEMGTESNVEIDWKTFAGNQGEIYSSLILAHKSLTKSNAELSEYFYRLLFRGIVRLKEK